MGWGSLSMDERAGTLDAARKARAMGRESSSRQTADLPQDGRGRGRGRAGAAARQKEGKPTREEETEDESVRTRRRVGRRSARAHPERSLKLELCRHANPF